MESTERKSNAFVIGIGGVTNGGKTTVCQRLREMFPSTHILNMDDYYWPDDSPHHVRLPEFNNYANYDMVTAVDFDRMVDDVNKWKSSLIDSNSTEPRLLLVEGIFIFNHRLLSGHFDQRFFIMLEKETCQGRRKYRVYEPPEPVGYFDTIVWPAYISYKNQLFDEDNTVFIDGEQKQEDVFHSIHKHIINLVNKQ